MNRRQLLATVGLGLAAVSGCQSGTPSESTATPAGTDTPPTSPAAPQQWTTDDTASPLEAIVVRKAVTYETRLGSGGVRAAEDRQYVVAAIETTDRQSEYVFEAGGQTWAAGLPDTADGNIYSVDGVERPVVAFDIPSPLSAGDPRVRTEWGSSDWTLPDEAQSVLEARSPRFELAELAVPERVSQGETMTVELTATNVSETGGRFLAAVYWPSEGIADDDESHVVDRTVPAGESASATVDIDTAFTAFESGPVTLYVDGHVSASRDIRVENV